MASQTDLAYGYIKKKILDGSYRPSQKLTENELATIIGVSRNTVKNALLKLQQEQLVVIEPNKGASIRVFTLDEVLNYLEIREVVEGLVVRAVAKDISDSQIQGLKEIIEAMPVLLETHKLEEYSCLNKNFHDIIYKSARNVQAVELITMIKTQLIRYQFRTILVPGRSQESLKEHRKIYEALQAHDEVEAEKAIRDHVSNVRRIIEQNYQLLL